MNQLIEDDGSQNPGLAVAVGAVPVLRVDNLIIGQGVQFGSIAEFRLSVGRPSL